MSPVPLEIPQVTRELCQIFCVPSSRCILCKNQTHTQHTHPRCIWGNTLYNLFSFFGDCLWYLYIFFILLFFLMIKEHFPVPQFISPDQNFHWWHLDHLQYFSVTNNAQVNNFSCATWICGVLPVGLIVKVKLLHHCSTTNVKFACFTRSSIKVCPFVSLLTWWVSKYFMFDIKCLCLHQIFIFIKLIRKKWYLRCFHVALLWATLAILCLKVISLSFSVSIEYVSFIHSSLDVLVFYWVMVISGLKYQENYFVVYYKNYQYLLSLFVYFLWYCGLNAMLGLNLLGKYSITWAVPPRPFIIILFLRWGSC
jgi:hypothetical protein